ncbi:hypothetical protein Tco_1187746, partial [Tanacetum coccineum]
MPAAKKGTVTPIDVPMETSGSSPMETGERAYFVQADDGTFMEEPAGAVASIGKKVVSVGSLEWVRRYTLAWVNVEELQRVIE